MIVTSAGELDRADEFLNKYRLLEEVLNKKYETDEKSFGSPVVRFINDKESKPYRDKLNLCREIRNFLSHHSEFDGERIARRNDKRSDEMADQCIRYRCPAAFPTQGGVFVQ